MSEVNDVVKKIDNNNIESIKNKMENINHEFQGISPNGKYGLSFSNYDFNDDSYCYLRCIENHNFIIWNLANNEPLQFNHQGINYYFSMNCTNYSFSNNDKYLCIELKEDYGDCTDIIIDFDDMSVAHMDKSMKTIGTNAKDISVDKFIFSNDEKYLFTLYNVFNVDNNYYFDPDYLPYDSDSDDDHEYTSHYVQVVDLNRGTLIYYYSFNNLIHSACFNNDNSILTLLFTNNELIIINLNDCYDYIFYPFDDDDQDVDLSKISSLVISGKFYLYTRVYYFREKNDKYYLFFDQYAFEEFNFKKNENLLKIVYSYDQSHKGKDIVPNNSVDRVFLNKDLVQLIAEWL